MISCRFEEVEEASVFAFCTSLPKGRRCTWLITSQSTWPPEIEKEKKLTFQIPSFNVKSEKILDSRENDD